MQYHSCTPRWTSARGGGARPSLESAPAFCTGRLWPPHGADGPNQDTMSIWGGAVPSIWAAPSDFGVPAHDDFRVASRVQARLPVFHDHPTHHDASSSTRSKSASASSAGSNDHRRPDPIRGRGKGHHRNSGHACSLISALRSLTTRSRRFERTAADPIPAPRASGRPVGFTGSGARLTDSRAVARASPGIALRAPGHKTSTR